jgi:hypothetical protein
MNDTLRLVARSGGPAVLLVSLVGCFGWRIEQPCDEVLERLEWNGDIFTSPADGAVVDAGTVSFSYGDPEADGLGMTFDIFVGHLVITADQQPPQWIPWVDTPYLDVPLEEGGYLWWLDGYFESRGDRVVDCPFPRHRLIVE